MFYDTNESESCLVMAPAKHASESVLVVGELLCTGVQANTERHSRKETREMCSCWGYKQQLDVAVVGEADELEEDVEQYLSCLEGVIEVEG